MPCPHASSGCNYPEGECGGACGPKMVEFNGRQGTKVQIETGQLRGGLRGVSQIRVVALTVVQPDGTKATAYLDERAMSMLSMHVDDAHAEIL